MFLVKELGGKIKRDGILVIGDRGSESFIYPISGKGQPMLSDELVFIRDRFANLLEWSVNTDLTKVPLCALVSELDSSEGHLMSKCP
ncbi:hypothetical protein CDL15_Pgr004490 [Punica granatum]|uniref:Uncharacterized protein n=1 Tax=Punica granatum TaxID=22663 RepID=A0A218WCU8_PUNGR|nr:hypothetical protein CDL15_Pgr004490 [Punica granatum]